MYATLLQPCIQYGTCTVHVILPAGETLPAGTVTCGCWLPAIHIQPDWTVESHLSICVIFSCSELQPAYLHTSVTAGTDVLVLPSSKSLNRTHLCIPSSTYLSVMFSQHPFWCPACVESRILLQWIWSWKRWSFCQKMPFIKTGGLSWQWSLKTGFTESVR